MLRRFAQHLCDVCPHLLLTGASPGRLAAQPAQPVDQLNSGPLQLLDSDDAPDRLCPSCPLRLWRSSVIPGVAGDLALESADLLTQRGADRTGVAAGIDIGKWREILDDGLATTIEIERRCKRTAVEPPLARLRGSRCCDRFELAKLIGPSRDERPPPPLRVDQASGLESPVDGAGRIGIHPGEISELADARDPIARTQHAVDDHAADLPFQLRPDREIAVPVDAEVDALRPLRLVRR